MLEGCGSNNLSEWILGRASHKRIGDIKLIMWHFLKMLIEFNRSRICVDFCVVSRV
jgi:hypothetical protein